MISLRTLKAACIVLITLLFNTNAFSKEVAEIPFIISAKGQILVQAYLNHQAEPKIFILSSVDRTTVRKDKRAELYKMKIDTSGIKLRLNTLSFAGGFEVNDLKIDWRNLSKRDKEYYGSSIFGTIGPAILKKQVCQFNFKTMRLKLTKKIKQLNIAENALSTNFSSSFLNSIPTIEVYCSKIGKTDIVIDINSLLGINFPIEKYQEKAETINNEILFNNVYINELKFDKLPLSLSNKAPAVMGLKFLKDYIVTLDFIDKKLYLEPNKTPND